MLVKEVMAKGVIGVQETADLSSAVETMLDANVAALFVLLLPSETERAR